MSHPHLCMVCGLPLVCDEGERGCHSGREVTCDRCVQKAHARLWPGRTPTVQIVALSAEQTKTLRKIGEKTRLAVAERNKAIIEAVAQGGTLREVGSAVGLTHAAVKRIVDKAS